MALKGFSESVKGPKGMWYRAVNERIKAAGECATVESLLSLLGPPDKVEAGTDVYSPSKFMADIGSIFSFGDERAKVVLTYVDPYRPRYRYKFGIVEGNVDSSWREVVHESKKDII